MSEAATAPRRRPCTADGVFLVHGLGGTQYDLGSMHKRLRNAGFVTHSLTLPGHGTKPEDLVGVTAEDWIDAVVTKYREIRDAHPTLHVMGMCMGSLLSAALAERERHAKGRLVLLAAPIYIDGWATPWYRDLRPFLYGVPGLRQRMKIEEEDPFGIKNEQLRAIVKAKFERGENFHYRWVPRMPAASRPAARDRDEGGEADPVPDARRPRARGRTDEPTLGQLSGRDDRRRPRADGRARGQLSHDLRGQRQGDCREERARILRRGAAGGHVRARERAADDALRATRGRGRAARRTSPMAISRPCARSEFPISAWVHPGRDRIAGAHVGKAFASLAARLPELGAPRFTAFGTSVWNRGVALVPATLVASREGASLESQGSLLSAWHAGKLLELRWFADEVERDDVFFGPPDPAAAGPSELEQAFETATAASRTLRTAPDNDTLLALYALYKQASAGDVVGERPGALTWWVARNTMRGRNEKARAATTRCASTSSWSKT